jgi:hypothetical protein
VPVLTVWYFWVFLDFGAWKNTKIPHCQNRHQNLEKHKNTILSEQAPKSRKTQNTTLSEQAPKSRKTKKYHTVRTTPNLEKQKNTILFLVPVLTVWYFCAILDFGACSDSVVFLCFSRFWCLF